jgi:hypothetical protein
MKNCILTITKDDNFNYLTHWIDYHLKIGFDHIFIIDNNLYENKLNINNDKVTILPYYNVIFEQPIFLNISICYLYASLYICKLNYDYMLIIDVDEYFYSKYNNVNDFVINEMYNNDINHCVIKWETYDDNNIIYEKDVINPIKSFTHVQNKINCSFDIFENCASGCKTFYKLYNLTEYNFNINEHDILNNIGILNIFEPHTYNNRCNIYKNGKCTNIDPSVAVIKHYRFRCLENFIKRKIKSQGFKIKDYQNINISNMVKDFFSINQVTMEKIIAFKEICKENNVDLNENELQELNNYTKNISVDKVNLLDNI